MKEIISKIECGDMLLKYETDESGKVGFSMIPSHMEGEEKENKNYRVNSLVQYKALGDTYPGAYGNGVTFHNSPNKLIYKGQEVEESEDKKVIDTRLEDERGYVFHHIVTWWKSDVSVEVKTTVKNESENILTLEFLSSFELSNITPFVEGMAHDALLIHRLRSKWSHEARLTTDTVEDLQLEPSWSTWSVSDEKFGQAGSMPCRKFMPFAAVEDTVSGVLWGAQLAHEASWQMEFYRQDDCLHLDGGLADREFGHWMKELVPGEEFETPTAILSVCRGGGIDNISQRLTQAGQKYADKGPESEQQLPVMFNEYCTTWGCPSHENISGIVEAIKDKGFEYFVIDCGWFKRAGVPWDISMGDYNISSDLFPNGLEETVGLIKKNGMVPGIWFEIDNVGRAAEAWNSTEHLLKRDGYTLETESRRFWDMNDPWVQDYLEKNVIGLLKDKGFGYIKMDYNDTIGIGCDGCESLGEGLRQNMEASVDFVRRIKDEVPGIIVENCASGGHKTEPLMMSICSMASFSDAHECEEIPVIAANLHRMILPRQSQIWAVIRQKDSLKRICYSVANTFLGRMCLSGDVTNLTDEQWRVIDEGIAFYKEIAPIIKKGYTHRFGPYITSERHLKGWQGVVRAGENGEAFVLIHTFRGKLPERIEIPLPGGCPQRIDKIYSDAEVKAYVKDGAFYFIPEEEMSAAAFLLR